jgi:hypothetical protein
MAKKEATYHLPPALARLNRPKIREGSLRHKVYEELRRDGLRESSSSGWGLTRADLCKRLGASKQSVTGALSDIRWMVVRIDHSGGSFMPDVGGAVARIPSLLLDSDWTDWVRGLINPELPDSTLSLLGLDLIDSVNYHRGLIREASVTRQRREAVREERCRGDDELPDSRPF